MSLNDVLIALAFLGGLAAVITIVTTLTKWGRRSRHRFAALISHRSLPPRTHVHIEPDTRFCVWSQSPAPKGPLKSVTFQMPCLATNLTPNYAVQLLGVELRGVAGTDVWGSVQVFTSGQGGVTDTLPVGIPARAMLIVVLERDALPRGSHRARMIVRDHLGNRHRTPKATFRRDRLPRQRGLPSPEHSAPDRRLRVADHGDVRGMMDDPDRATFDALLELAETGVDTSDAIGDLLDRRAAEEEAFVALVAPLTPGTVCEVILPDPDDAEARWERLAKAPVLRVSAGT